MSRLTKLQLKIPKQVFDLPTASKIRVAEELIKALGFKSTLKESEADHKLWAAHSNENMAQLEDLYYENLTVPLWYMMLELFDVLGLELPVSEELTIEKSVGYLWSELEACGGNIPELLEKGIWREDLHSRDMQGKFAHKWGKAVHIGLNIDTIRKTLAKDLKQKGMPRDKAVALMVGLVDKAALRIGNDNSADEGIYGLTTLRREHVRVDGDTIHLDFIGKKKVHHTRSVTDKALAKAMRETLGLKGGKRSGGKESADDAVFKFVNTQGELRTPSQYVVNKYLDQWGITAKDFRTFHASRIVYEELKGKNTNVPEEKEKNVREAIAHAAEYLGHEPDTSRRCYVDPKIIDLYLGNLLKSYMTEEELREIADETIEAYANAFQKWYNTTEMETELHKAFDDDDGSKLRERLMSGVRRRFASRLKYKPGGDAMTVRQIAELNKVMGKYTISAQAWAESMAVRAAILAKLISETEKSNVTLARLALETAPYDIASVRLPFALTESTSGVAVPILPLQGQEIHSIQWAALHAAELVQTQNEYLKAGIRQMVIQAKMARWTPQELASALYDKFGQYNRDWRRIAITELSMASNNGYLATLNDGDKLTIDEAADCCPQCARLNVGKAFTYRLKPGNPETEVWVGKSNFGRKAKEYIPCVPLHPSCRGRYTKFNHKFFRMGDNGKLVLKSKEEILAEIKE